MYFAFNYLSSPAAAALATAIGFPRAAAMAAERPDDAFRRGGRSPLERSLSGFGRDNARAALCADSAWCGAAVGTAGDSAGGAAGATGGGAACTTGGATSGGAAPLASLPREVPA